MEILTLQPNKEDAGTRIDAWLASQVEQGIALDPRIYTGLYFLTHAR